MGQGFPCWSHRIFLNSFPFCLCSQSSIDQSLQSGPFSSYPKQQYKKRQLDAIQLQVQNGNNNQRQRRTVMSVVASTAEQICHSPTNQSKAKMLYSFPKSPRFPKGKENQCDNFYDLSKRGQLRTTGLGYGQKYDFTKDFPKTPAPGWYEAETTFETSKKKNKGFGFGSGRSQMQATGLIKKNDNPGPGAYEPVSSRSAIYSSIKGKGKTDNREQIYVPGPGTYEACSNFNKTGTVFCSRFKNKSACKFNREDKLKIENRRVPGPGTYDTSKTEFSPEGRYFFSRLQSAKSSKFGKSIRLSSANRCQTPGPGNYRLPSQFGYYLSRNALNDINPNSNSTNI